MWQWKNHAPGLSALHRKTTLPVGGMVIVSRREGLDWPSSRGGLIVVSLDVTSNDLDTTWNS